MVTGPGRVAGHLGLLPRGELGVGVRQRLVRLLLQPRHLLGDGDRVVVAVDSLEVGDLALKLRHRLLEIKIGAHVDGSIHSLLAGGARAAHAGLSPTRTFAARDPISQGVAFVGAAGRGSEPKAQDTEAHANFA